MPAVLTVTASEIDPEYISEFVPVQSIVTDCEMVNEPKATMESRQETVPLFEVTPSATESVLQGVARRHTLDVLASSPLFETQVATPDTANAGGTDQKEADRAANVATNSDILGIVKSPNENPAM
jgi:hypothetical protein